MKKLLSYPIRKMAEKLSNKKLKNKIMDFFNENPYPNDDQLHAWAEKNKFDVHKIEGLVYEIASDFITGKEINKEQLLPYLRNFLEDTSDDWNYITPEKLKKQMDAGKADYFILDIRKPDVYKKGHIKGAKNIFWMDLLKSENLKKLPENKKILLYCYVGHTSSQALVLLKLLGYDVISLKFGMGISPVEGIPVAGWTDMNYPVVEEKK